MNLDKLDQAIAQLEKEMANRPPEPTFEKQCKKCGEVKSSKDFHRVKANKDGRHQYCKACMKEYYKNNDGKTRKEKRETGEAVLEKFCEEIKINNAKACGLQWRTKEFIDKFNQGELERQEYMTEIVKILKEASDIKTNLTCISLNINAHLEAYGDKIAVPQLTLERMTWANEHLVELEKMIYKQNKKLMR